MRVQDDLLAVLAASSRENSIRLLQTELERRRVNASPLPLKPILLEKSADASPPQFTSITRYAWDQSRKWVKVYVTLPGLEGLDDDKVHFVVEGNSLRLEVTGLPAPSPNMRLLVVPLFSTVETSSCSCTRKPNNMLLLKLLKAGALSPPHA